MCYGSDKLESIAYLHVGYPSGFFMHLHVNWISPVKIRQMLIAGSEKMIVFDDLKPSEKVRLYDRGIIVSRSDAEATYRLKVDYRSGDMLRRIWRRAKRSRRRRAISSIACVNAISRYRMAGSAPKSCAYSTAVTNCCVAAAPGSS